MSKLDRFLISEGLMETCSNIFAITLDRKKLKHLKLKIHTWIKSKKESLNNQKVRLKDMLSDIDMALDKVDGMWIESPSVVKTEFLMHFKNRFDHPVSSRFILVMNFPNTLSIDQRDDMEREVSKDEIKRAVWDCGLDKSPRPVGFTFVGVLGHLVNEVQSTFFENRKILDGPFILDEKDNNSLWARVIMALHGDKGLLDLHLSRFDLVRYCSRHENLKTEGIDLLGFIKKRVGNASKNITLAHKLVQDNVRMSLRRCPRGGTEFEQFTSLMASLEGYALPDIQD
nr:RNA-directed DNA polymerase, eukaryota, reverse transcriptase zinc-binding domain protein [Tanacetum cinerariifolium]